MTNDLSIRPAHLGTRDGFPGFADTIGFAQPPRISMDGDVFNVLDENKQHVLPADEYGKRTRPVIDTILLWENDTRLYYPKGDYDRNAATPPTCFSDNRITPSLGAIQPQSVLCANCPHSKWDQPTPRGNLVPACDSRYKVACLVAGAGGRVFLLSVAPASRKAYENYRRHLRANHANPQDVITKLGYVDKAFTFEFAGWISEATTKFLAKIFETDEPALVVNAFDKPRETGALTPPPLQVSSPELAPVRTVVTQLEQVPPPPEFVGHNTVHTVPTEPARRRGRPPKDMESSIQDSASKGNGGGFGMETPQTPPTNIQEALDRAFPRV